MMRCKYEFYVTFEDYSVVQINAYTKQEVQSILAENPGKKFDKPYRRIICETDLPIYEVEMSLKSIKEV